MIFFAEQSSSAARGTSSALALLILIAVIAGWIGVRAIIRRIRAQKTENVVHGAFTAYALEALANAARLDGRTDTAERDAILKAMRDIAGAGFDSGHLDAALASAALTKDELVAYLEEHSRSLSNDQKVQFLKALLAVFVADGKFDEVEHRALIDYTAAVGFDRQSAPQRLRRLVSDMVSERII